jgi:hypothetical protein
MSEIVVGTEKEIHLSGLDEKPGLPDALRNWFVYPDEWVKEQDALKMQNEWLQAEREEILQYVKNLKMFAVYLSGKTKIGENNLSNINFERAEKNLPEYLRKEIEVDISALGILY